MSQTEELSLTEYAVLGLLAEGASHGFALARQLDADGPVGRIFTVRRSLVYRALDRLVELGHVEPTHVERGDSAPNRVIHRLTRSGREQLRTWLGRPVGHVRDIRIEFLLKLTLLERSSESPYELIDAQQVALQPTLDALDDGGDDHVEQWRRHNARAAAAFLDELAAKYS